MNPWLERAAAAGLLALFLGLVLGSMRLHSPTVDEFAHLPAGYSYWKTGDFSLYPKNPPLIKMIAALPWLILKPEPGENFFGLQRAWRPWMHADDFMRLNAGRYRQLVFWGRVPILALALALGLGIWRWSRRLYGPLGGMISLFGFCLCPNFLAHSGLATVDVGASLFIFAAVFAGLRFLDRPGWGRAFGAGLFLGLAQLSKFTALFLIPLFLLSPALAGWWNHKHPSPLSSAFSFRRFTLSLALILLAAWVILLAGYRFHCDAPAFPYMHFKSSLFQTAQIFFPALPLPLPMDYLTGLDAQLRETQHYGFPNYLFGQWYYGGKWYYFPVAIAVKTPIPILIGFGLALFLKRRGPGGRSGWQIQPEEFALLGVIVLVYLGMTLRNQAQIGIRYLLPLFPFAYVLMGRWGILLRQGTTGRWYRWAGVGLGLWLMIGTLRLYPDYLAYFNELIGGPKHGYQVLLDSNLDWGQDLPGLADYLKEHNISKVHLAYFGHADPAIYGINYDLFQEPNQPGVTAISAAYLMGFPYTVTYTNPWTQIPTEKTAGYQKRKPLAVIGHSIFLYQD